jgi:hypothetical protein
LQEVVDWLGLVVEPGSITELRNLNAVENAKYPPFTVSGYFDYEHLEMLARAAMAWTLKAEGCYITINPVLPDLLARAANRMVLRPKCSTRDSEIVRRTGLVFDFDPRRPAGVSATCEEKASAWERLRRFVADRSQEGWPAPIEASSGNGFHTWYKIDLPNDEEARGLIERVLKAADQLFSDDRVAIDISMFNAARICKLYGTLARKGDSTPDRPHRWSRVLSVPDPYEVVPGELLREFAALYQPPPPKSKVPRPSQIQTAAKPSRNGDGDGLRPGDDFEQRATWESILEPHGWVKDREIGDVRSGKRFTGRGQTRVGGYRRRAAITSDSTSSRRRLHHSRRTRITAGSPHTPC